MATETRVSGRKRLRGMAAAMAAYTGHDGPVTVEAVLGQVPQELKQRLTGRELGLVMSAVNEAYQNGRGSHGGLDLCDDCVWVPWGPDNGAENRGYLVPIAALRAVNSISFALTSAQTISAGV